MYRSDREAQDISRAILEKEIRRLKEENENLKIRRKRKANKRIASRLGKIIANIPTLLWIAVPFAIACLVVFL